MAGDDHGPWLTTAMIIFLTWSILFSLVRLWAKLRVKTAGWDDATVSIALVGQGKDQGRLAQIHLILPDRVRNSTSFSIHCNKQGLR